jgi:diguanylate cyclase (GGDEF)-like protein
MDDCEIIIEEDDDCGVPALSLGAWTMLVVDDDPSVHAVTRFALEDFVFEGRSLRFISAYSGAEAKQVMATEPDVAIVLLDVVMETDTAGLEVAEHIRNTLGNRLTRIILRTGQPGQAPERRVIVNYDINDYKEKNELTAQKLFTVVLAGLRAYNQIAALENSRHGLEKILAASMTLYEQRSVAQFVDGVVLQIRSLIQDAQGALLCAVIRRDENGDGENEGDVRVVAGVAPFAFRTGALIRSTLPPQVCAEIAAAVERQESLFAEDRCVVYFKTASHAAAVVYLCGHRPLSVLDQKLLEVFCSKVAIGFDNAHLFEQIAFEKNHDAVTRLLNRAAFVAELNRRLVAGEEPDGFAVCVLDCDRFRDVNESLGYAAGDALLELLARRVEASLRPGDMAARLGGDQFVMMRRGERDSMEPWCRDLLTSLSESAVIHGCEIIPSAAAGLVYADAEQRAEDLIADADRAMRRAKRLGGGRYECAVERPPSSGEGRLILITQLIHAVRRRQFELYYQPLVRTEDGALEGFEALIRWRHPQRGLLPPAAFINVVEETGLILPVGSWVMQQAAAQMAQWSRDIPGADRLHVSVNVSARQFVNNDLMQEVKTALSDSGLGMDRMKLEITESLIMNDPDGAARALRGLKDLGVRLALDDFGTGYSSLSYIDRFPFDVLKIDRSFVQSMLRRRETMTVVEVICMLASRLGLDVVGEGVEREEEAQALLGLGCRLSQGYLYGRPMPVEEATETVRRAMQAPAA